MGLDFSKTTTQQQMTAPDTKNEIEVVEKYDIVADRQHMNETLVNSAEVDALVSTIAVNDLETIVSFGAQAAEEISKASDVVLNSMNTRSRIIRAYSERFLETCENSWIRFWRNITPWGTKLTRSMCS